MVGAQPRSSLCEAELDYDEIQRTGNPKRDFGPRSNDDLHIVYTGGTTGRPKGVMWRHEDVFYSGLQGGNPGGAPFERPEQLAAHVAAGSSTPLTFLPAAPLIHGAAQWAALIGLFGGGRVVLQPGRSFNAALVAASIERHNVNTLTLVGDAMARPFVDVISQPAKQYDLSSLFVVASAGAVFSPVVLAQLRERLPHIFLVNSFGSTEAGHQGSAYHGTPNELGQEGRPSFMMDMSSNVLDDEHRPIEPGSGKMGWLARSGRLPVGYYNEPQLTAQRFISVDGRRWVLPGDCATIEKDGRITIFGRGSGCINTGGEKVFPEEIEEVLKSHEGVFDAVVVGVEDADWMQRVAAAVEPRPNVQLSLEDLQQHLNLTGTFLMCRAALPHLLKTKGAIVNMASAAALGGHPWMAAYSASKGGILAMTRSIALEYVKQGLRANAICPGGVKTPIHKSLNLPPDADFDLLKRAMPFNDFATPEEIASVVAFLGSSDASHLNGIDIRVDGGVMS